MELESRLGALCLVGGSSLTGFWCFRAMLRGEDQKLTTSKCKEGRGAGGCGIWRRRLRCVG